MNLQAPQHCSHKSTKSKLGFGHFFHSAGDRLCLAGRTVKRKIACYICIGLARTIYICGVFTVFFAEISPNVWSNTVYKYGSGQPYVCTV
jgi:hypothetical protein